MTNVLTAPHAPWQNPYVERFIGSARRECLDHLIVFTANWPSAGPEPVSGILRTVSHAPVAGQGRADFAEGVTQHKRQDHRHSADERPAPSVRTPRRVGTAGRNLIDACQSSPVFVMVVIVNTRTLVQPHGHTSPDNTSNWFSWTAATAAATRKRIQMGFH